MIDIDKETTEKLFDGYLKNKGKGGKMSLFCKHEWDYLKAKINPTYLQLNRVCGNYQEIQTMKCGVSVYCTKCGKVNKRLSKKLGRLYATHLFNKLKNKAKEKAGKSDFITVKIDISKSLGNK